jgi:hypothetical protein
MHCGKCQTNYAASDSHTCPVQAGAMGDLVRRVEALEARYAEAGEGDPVGDLTTINKLAGICRDRLATIAAQVIRIDELSACAEKAEARTAALEAERDEARLRAAMLVGAASDALEWYGENPGVGRLVAFDRLEALLASDDEDGRPGARGVAGLLSMYAPRCVDCSNVRFGAVDRLACRDPNGIALCDEHAPEVSTVLPWADAVRKAGK